MKTTDRRIRVINHGRENWRTEARDPDTAEGWTITGPPYPTATEALANVERTALYYFATAAELDAAHRDCPRPAWCADMAAQAYAGADGVAWSRPEADQ